MNLKIFCALVLQLLLGVQVCLSLYKMFLEFDRYEIEYSVIGDFSKIRVRKFNRTTPVINGSYDLTVDLDDSYEIGITCSRSELGNNQYNLFPMKLTTMPVCDFINAYGPDYQWIWENKSNFIYVGPEGVCPWPKGTYWVKDLALDASLLPPVIPNGYYRCYLDVNLAATKELVHHQAYYSRIYRELTKN
ncbi:hypothetical protein RP20_CCG008158 [Aedes albopictus]|nr:hypothetical protein RP20_CCG008158 [Aedes albopictus]